MHDTVTYFTAHCIRAVPELARYLRRPLPVTAPDLMLLDLWMDRAGLSAVAREAVTFTRSAPPHAFAAQPPISIRRYLHDQQGRLLTLTDIGFTDTWQTITLEYETPVRTGPSAARQTTC